MQDPAGILDASVPNLLRFTSASLIVDVLGGIKLAGLDRLQVALRVRPADDALPVQHFHERLDLYTSDRARKLVRELSAHFGIERQQARQFVAALTASLEEYRMSRIEAQESTEPQPYRMSPDEKAVARKYLGGRDLLKRTGRDIGRSGVVGEETNRLLMFLAFTSRLRSRPLHVVALAASGTGKTYLQNAVSRLIPDEERVEITALSENALYYFGQTELRHKLVLIEDLDGAEHALYPLREFQSKGRLSKSVPLKDAHGEIKTVHRIVEGPACVTGCTTRESLYADNASRVLLLHLDPSPEQDRAILRYQKELSAGLVNETEQAEVRRLFQNVQRLLFAVSVRNPFALKLALPPGIRHERRANQLYLDVIEAVTFYHQQQRKVQTDKLTGERFIESTVDDVAAANELILSVLTAKADELSGACRTFFEELKAWLSKQERLNFHAPEARRALGVSPSSARRYLNELREYGLCEITGGNPHRGGYEYRVTAAGEEGNGREAIRAFLAQRMERLKR